MNQMIASKSKSILSMELSGFQSYFVWVETDNIYDEDEVAPYICDSLPAEDWSYYLFAHFRLADDSKFDGYLRWSYGSVTYVAIYLEKKMIDFSLVDEIRRSIGDTSITIASRFERSVSSVFPILYRTEVGFEGSPIEGSITF